MGHPRCSHHGRNDDWPEIRQPEGLPVLGPQHLSYSLSPTQRDFLRSPSWVGAARGLRARRLGPTFLVAAQRGTGKEFDHWEYRDERTEALELWCTHIERLLTPAGARMLR